MAIVVLVLWLFTAGAGFYLLVTSNLGRAHPAARPPAATVLAAQAPARQAAAPVPPPSQREMRRAVRDRFDPPSLTAAKSAPVVPGLRPLLEFAHPAFAIVGLGFWLAFTFVHVRALGWIGFGLVTATVCLGLTWYAANARAAGKTGSSQTEPAPSFSTRIVILHGSLATVTFVLAALAALVLSR